MIGRAIAIIMFPFITLPVVVFDVARAIPASRWKKIATSWELPAGILVVVTTLDWMFR